MAIVVIGAVFVDIKGFPHNTYIPQGRNAGDVRIVHGGVGRNLCEDIANLELRPRFVSLVDESPEGRAVVEKLRRHKADTRYVLTEPEGMGLWLAIFDETGDIVSSISKRPDMNALAALLDEKGDEIFADADSVVVEIDIDQAVAKQVFRYAEKYHIPVYAVVANMSIAAKRRDFIKRTDCFVCNQQEAGLLFVEDYSACTPEELCERLPLNILNAEIPAIVVTMGAQGAVYAERSGNRGIVRAQSVKVRDTTGAGDAFCAGVAAGLTYGKTLAQAVEIGTRLAASVITVSENVCPRFLPGEFGIKV